MPNSAVGEGAAVDTVRNLFWQVAALVLSIAAGILFTRALGPDGKGVVATLQANLDMSLLLGGLGISSGIVYRVAGGASPSRTAAAALAGVALGMALVTAGVVAVAISPWSGWAFPGPPELRTVFAFWVVLAFAAGAVSAASTAHLIAARAFGPANAVRALSAGATLGAAVLIGRTEWNRVMAVLIAILLVQALGAFASLWAARRTIGSWPWFASLSLSNDVFPLFRVASLVFAADMIQFLNYRLDLWIVGAFHGPGAVGVYAAGVGIVQLAWLPSQSVLVVLTPHLAASDPKRRRELVARAARIVVPASVIGVAVIAVAADAIVAMLYGDRFREASDCVRLLAPGVAAGLLSKVLAAHCAVSGHLRWNVAAATTGLLTTILLDFFLIPRWGIHGAAVASSSSYAIVTLSLFGMWRTDESLRVPGRDLLAPGWADLSVAMNGLRRALRLT